MQELQHEKPRWKEEEEAAVEEADKTLFWLDDEEVRPPSDSHRPPTHPHSSTHCAHTQGKTERAIPKGIPPDQTAPLRFKGLPAPEDLDKPKEKPKNDEGDGEEDDEDIEIGGNGSEAMKALMLERKKRAEAEKARLEALKKKRDRRAKMHRPVVTRIPWHLLDELEVTSTLHTRHASVSLSSVLLYGWDARLLRLTSHLLTIPPVKFAIRMRSTSSKGRRR